MEKFLVNSQEGNLDRQIELEEKLFDTNCEEVVELFAEKEEPLSEQAKVLKERMSLFLGPIKILSDETLYRQQNLQQKEVAEHFSHDPSVELSSFSNLMDGSNGFDMKEELEKIDANEKKIVILMSGITQLSLKNQKDLEQISPIARRLMMLQNYLKHPVRMFRYGIDIKKILKGLSISDYFIKATKTIQDELFDKEPVKVLIVRNANSQNLSDVIENGGENTVLVVHGHGTMGSVDMTDKVVSSSDFGNPPVRLKAFVQHTCAKTYGEEEELGKNFAEQTFGWDRITFAADYIGDPLRPRSNFKVEKDKENTEKINDLRKKIIGN